MKIPNARTLRNHWQLIAASVIALTGTFFGAVYGCLSAAFAGDSWWTSQLAFTAYQYSIAVGVTCLGAVPGAVWLLCLKQKWTIPILFVAACFLPTVLLQATSISNEAMAMICAGAISLGFVLGLVTWLRVRRPARA